MPCVQKAFKSLRRRLHIQAFLLFKSVPDVGVVISDRRVIGAMKDDALVGMPVSEYLRHCGYRVLEAANSDEALLLLQKPDTQVDVVMIDVGGSGAMSGFKLTQRVHTFLASWGLGDWLLGIGPEPGGREGGGLPRVSLRPFKNAAEVEP